MYKIAHFGDTHIKLFKQHEEYKYIFSEIYANLKKENVDYIIHCGDLFHNKTSLSPEGIQICSDFLRNLADIAPTYIIAGNHDLTLNNSSRMDAISPVVNMLNHPRLNYLKVSGEVRINNEITLNPLVITEDASQWAKPSDLSKINIALYHGAVAGVTTDIGYALEHSDHDIDIFKDHDYAFLGDIHKTNQILDNDGRIRYPGSTVQQNFGETDDKGFLIWDIENKDNFTCRHIVIKNPKPFFTIKIDESGQFDDSIVVPASARIRIVGETNLSVNDVKKAIDIVKTKFSPESVTFLNKANSRIDVTESVKNLKTDDLRDIATQERLITEYLKDYNPTSEVLSKVMELNKKYNAVALESEDSLRNVRWSLKKFKWSNLFNYGEGNKIDFTDLNGTVGIFGKNYSGKSSIIDSVLWTIQNSTSKNIRKNVDIINQNKDIGTGEIEIEVDDKTYIIERTAEKYIKKLNNEETLEAKTDVSFSVCDSVQTEDCIKYEKGNLNGLDRNETDKNIRKIFGTIEDFLFTAMSSQMGSLDYINEGSTRRKEILGKFLDLDLFAKKFKLAVAEAAELKGALKRLDNVNYDVDIQFYELKAKELFEDSKLVEKEILELKEKLQDILKIISEFDLQIAMLPKLSVVDITVAESKLAELKKIIGDNLVEIEKDRETIKSLESALQISKQMVDNIDVSDLKKKKEQIASNKKELEEATRDLQEKNKNLLMHKSNTAILGEVPCGDNHPTCKFLINAWKHKADIPGNEELIEIGKKRKEQAELSVAEIDEREVSASISSYNSLLEQRRVTEKNIANLKLEVERLSNKNLVSSTEISTLEENIAIYHKNEESAIKLQKLSIERSAAVTERDIVKKKLKNSEESIINDYREHGSMIQKILSLRESKEELERLREEHSAIALFEKAMHSNGISYDIIRNKLPIINEEISLILSNVTSFEVFFKDDGRKLDILIKHPKYDARPIELGSGAEKTLAAMAIRLALTKISSLPVGSLYILDEPATALDEENMEGFTRIIEMIKGQFKTVILISHLPELKDIVDQHIIIEQKGGFASVEV